MLAVHNYFKDECGHLAIFLPIRFIGNYKTLSAII